MKMTEYLGKHVSELLESEPFIHWTVDRSIEEDLNLEITYYVFNGKGLELHCDADDTVKVLFLYSEEYGGFEESLFDSSFLWTRTQTLEHLGSPSKSGDKINDQYLGECGAWDLFSRSDFAIHVQYMTKIDKIDKITLMQKDVVPE